MTTQQMSLSTSTLGAQNLAPASKLAGLAPTLLSLTALIFFVAVVALLSWALVYDLLAWTGFIERVGRARPVLTIVLGAFTFGAYAVIAQTLFHRQDLPSGVYVTEKNGKRLLSCVEDIAAAANISKPDHIVLLPNLEAFAAEVPTKGIFRRTESVLGLGYPLLSILSFEQGCAVIAHELKHLDARHSNSSLRHGLVSRLLGVVSSDPDDGIVRRILCLPGDGYHYLSGRLGAHTSRLHEFEADQLAAELFGKQNAADALIVLETVGTEFYGAVMRPLTAAWQRGEPVPQSILGAVDTSIRSTASRETLLQRLAQSLAETTGRYDSHPCLAERIAMLGAGAELPSFTTSINAAKGLLWEDERGMCDEVDQLLNTELGDRFRQRSEHVAEVEATLEQVFPDVASGIATREQAEIISLLMERSLFSSQTLKRHQTIIANYGDVPSSACEIAQQLLDDKDVRGAEEMLKIYEAHPLMSGEARGFLDWVGHHPADWPVDQSWLKDWATNPETKDRIARTNASFEAMNARFRTLSDSRSPLLHHGLASWHIELIVRELCRVFEVQNLFLARKQAADLPVPAFQMLILTKTEIDELPSGIGSLCCLPGPLKYMVGNTHGTLGGWERTLRDHKPALIYSAPPASEKLSRAA